MYIFSFVLIKSLPIFTSCILVGFFLSIKMIFNINYRRVFFNILNKKNIILIFAILIFIQGYSAFITTINCVYDYSIIKTLINQFITLNIGVMVYAYFKLNNSHNKILDYVIYAFILQSLIQLTSFCIPSINDFLNNFRTNSAIEIGQWKYSGIRGLAVSGSNFYGLSSAYGLMYIIYFIRWNEIFKNNNLFKVLSIGILLFGSFSAGRTSMIGFIFGIMYFIMKKFTLKRKAVSLHLKKIKFKKKNLIILIILIIFIIIGGVFIQKKGINENIENKIKDFKSFSLEMIYNFVEGDGLSTTSSSEMFTKMYFKVSEKTLFLGDGAYHNKDGGYYKNTDVGYMRNILFFGLLGFSLLFIYQIQFFKWSKKNFLKNITFLMYLVILHLKGDIIGFLIITQSILMLFFIYELEFYRGDKINE